MRAVATEAFKAYYGMQPLDFPEGHEFSGDVAVYMLQTGAPVEPADDEARALLSAAEAQPPAPEEQDVPPIDGTINEVLAWVGDDQERAVQARDEESARDKPRSTLLAQLDEIIAD
ncbi:hypothetical protein [Nonomuraea pusilla]|uniref:Uncharacterized protein n=1 Tax=Nonomuraea pusilla TaxID=46177 RepID=A0A1H8K1Y6_9ACTN|nr:hypothetical protein [Nonomuraea pusilla]SEN86805.1 hypothetical protein SAMN05660976_08500 [Nonomuraea pusilla]